MPERATPGPEQQGVVGRSWPDWDRLKMIQDEGGSDGALQGRTRPMARRWTG